MWPFMQAVFDAFCRRFGTSQPSVTDSLTPSEEAERKGEALLISLLSQRQRIQYAKWGYFVVKAASGCEYRIRKTRFNNVDQLDDGKWPIRIWCLHTDDPTIPVCDNMAAQLLLLQADERKFRLMAIG